MPMEKRKIRIDLIAEFRIIDKETGLFEAHMVPDPARYEKGTYNGEEGYFESQTAVFFRQE